MLHTLLIKHYNNLLEKQMPERGKDEVSYFYFGDVFSHTPWDKVCQFSRKNIRRDFCEKIPNFIHMVVTLLQYKVWNFLPEISAKVFSQKLAHLVSPKVYKNFVPNNEV